MSQENDSVPESNTKTISPKWNMSWVPRSWFNSNADPDSVNSFETNNFFQTITNRETHRVNSTSLYFELRMNYCKFFFSR